MIKQQSDIYAHKVEMFKITTYANRDAMRTRKKIQIFVHKMTAVVSSQLTEWYVIVFHRALIVDAVVQNVVRVQKSNRFRKTVIYFDRLVRQM